MRWRTASAWLLLAWLPLACGEGRDVAAPSDDSPPVPISGLYEVTGRTVTVATGSKREIAGKVVLSENEGAYTATFSLNTTAPGADQAMPAEVIGTGEGTIEGRTLKGTADTQLVMSTVPGIDPGFAYIPHTVSTRIRSASTAVVANDGSITIEIENEAAPGQEYMKTRTSMRGRRISDAAIGALPSPRLPEVVDDDLADYDPRDYVEEEWPEEDVEE